MNIIEAYNAIKTGGAFEPQPPTDQPFTPEYHAVYTAWIERRDNAPRYMRPVGYPGVVGMPVCVGNTAMLPEWGRSDIPIDWVALDWEVISDAQYRSECNNRQSYGSPQ
jgi:hypothetical protein